MASDIDTFRPKNVDEKLPEELIYSDGRFSFLVIALHDKNVIPLLTSRDSFCTSKVDSDSFLLLAIKIRNASSPVLHTCCPQAPHSRKNSSKENVVCSDYCLSKNGNWQFFRIGKVTSTLWFDIHARDHGCTFDELEATLTSTKV